MSDEKNTDQDERPIAGNDEVEGHSVGKPVVKPVMKPIQANDDDADFEGHSMGKPVVKPIQKPIV